MSMNHSIAQMHIHLKCLCAVQKTHMSHVVRVLSLRSQILIQPLFCWLRVASPLIQKMMTIYKSFGASLQKTALLGIATNNIKKFK